MIFNYEYNSNTCYVPLHLSSILYSEDKRFITNYITEKCINNLLSFVSTSEYTNIIIDMKHIKGIPSRIFARFNSYSNSSKVILIVNASDKYNDEIKQSWTNSNKHINDGTVIGLTQALDLYDTEFENNEQFNKLITQCKINKIASYIKSTSSTNKIFLPSSNVWSNIYVDIKKTFIDQDIFTLLIYELANLINYNFTEDFELICVSNNGFAISNVLSSLFKKKVVYLMKLGPQSTLMTNDLIKNIGTNKKYLFVYDFSCLGTEIKLVKTIVNLFGSTLIGCIGVAKHLERKDSTDKNFTIFKINDDVDFEYKLFFKENEVVL